MFLNKYVRVDKTSCILISTTKYSYHSLAIRSTAVELINPNCVSTKSIYLACLSFLI